MKYYLEHEEHAGLSASRPTRTSPPSTARRAYSEFQAEPCRSRGSGLVSVEGGEASNVVPDWARCAYLDANGGRQERTIAPSGRSAHASTPEKGVNAIDKLMAALVSRAGYTARSRTSTRSACMGDYHGGKLGCGALPTRRAAGSP